MFEKILIANRGEIAVRIIRTCKEMGIKTVAIYSEADATSMHVQLADEAVCIGPGPATESYLRFDRIMSAAEITDVDAIHPGYGFLAENPEFVEICEKCNIKFIGPSRNAMMSLKDKAVSRELARKVGVPVPPGSEGIVNNEQEALKVAHQVGYPVIIKAIAGGGGRGMRLVHNDISLIKAFHTARQEAEHAFGNSGVYIEKYFENARHIEIQILADTKGNIVYLGERDCSIQRRHQKVIEECPSPFIENKFPDLRKKMGRAAIKIAEAAKYTNAGTVEFLVDEKGNFYFLEMNKRIQVEHPITEVVTGIDIVRQQILIAMGEPIEIKTSINHFDAHAIECRINAEDPFKNFIPCPGLIEAYFPPGGLGIRLDSHVYAGYEIPPYYDSMIGKLIVYGKSRQEAIRRMIRALNEYIISGVPTTIPLCKMIMEDPDFGRGEYNTQFLEKFLQRSATQT